MSPELYETGKKLVEDAPQLYIDLDVEADGKPGYGSLLSVGAVTPAGDTFYRELKPTSKVWVPHQRKFCEDHGLERERLLNEGMNPHQAMRELAEWEKEVREKADKTKSVLVAFNASFDYPWVDLQMIRAKTGNPFGAAGYCIKSLAHVLSPNYDWSKTNKNNLPRDVVPEGDFTHNALEDAIYQQKMHYSLVGQLATMGIGGFKVVE